MKNLFNTKHILVGVITALFAGLIWISLMRTFAHMAIPEIAPWVIPLVFVLAMIGLSVGFVGKHNRNTLLKVGLSTLFGTGLSPITILPIVGMVVLPLGKLAEGLGLINRAAMTSETATLLVSIAMLGIWLVVGVASGVLFLFVTIKKPEQSDKLSYKTALK